MAVVDLVELDDASALAHGKPRIGKSQPLPIKLPIVVTQDLFDRLVAHQPSYDVVLTPPLTAQLTQSGAKAVWDFRRDGETTIMNEATVTIAIGSEIEGVRLDTSIIAELLPDDHSDAERADALVRLLLSAVGLVYAARQDSDLVPSATFVADHIEQIH